MAGLTYRWKYIINVFFLCALQFACTKGETFLPAKTHEGRNVMGYFVDDILEGGIFGMRNDAISLTDSSLNLIYDDRNKEGYSSASNDYAELELYLSHTGNEESFVFEKANYRILNRRNETELYYALDSLTTNFVVVTFLNLNRGIVSGEFELNFVPRYEIHFSDTLPFIDTLIMPISITKGRFDLKDLD